MITRRGQRWSAVGAFLAFAVGCLVGISVAGAQDTRPADDPVSDIAKRLREGGINVSPEQIDSARRMMEDFRDGVPPDPNQLRSLVGDIRKQVENRQQKRLQDLLEASDDEWKILEPKIEKVRELSRLANDVTPAGMAMMGGMFAGFGGPGGPGAPDAGPGGPGGFRVGMFAPLADANAQTSDVEKKAEALKTQLDVETPNPVDVASALKAYRASRTKARDDLVKAEKELRGLLTLRQEAQLVAMDILE